MGTASYVLTGATGEALASTCHGAGRALSRHQAKTVTGLDLRDRLQASGIEVRARLQGSGIKASCRHYAASQLGPDEHYPVFCFALHTYTHQ